MTASFSSHYVCLHTHSVHVGVYVCAYRCLDVFVSAANSALRPCTGHRKQRNH